MRPHRFAAPMAAIALTLSGLSGPAHAAQPSAVPIPPFSDVPEYRANTDRTGVYPGPGPVEQPELVWSRSIAGAFNFNPILADGMLLAGGSDHQFYALDARTGVERWHFEAADEFRGWGAEADGTVVVASADGILHALDLATGKERWNHPDMAPGADIVDGVVYAPGTDQHAYGLDLNTGATTWSWAAPADVVNLTVADGTAYFSVSDGRLYAISVADGAEQWHVQTLAGVPGVAEVDGDTVYVSGSVGDPTTPDGEIYVIDRASGAVRWRFRTPSGNEITLGATANGALYAGTTDGSGLYALPTTADASGAAPKPLWHTESSASAFKNQALTGDLLYVPDKDPNEILALGATDGAVRWHLPLAGAPNGTLASGGMLFATDDSGVIAAYAEPSLKDAIGPTTSGPLDVVASASPWPVPNPFTLLRTLDPSSTSLHQLQAIAIGPDGLIYALDRKPSVTVIDPANGAIVRTWGRQGTREGEFDLSDPNGNKVNIAVGPDGTVFVDDQGNHRVQTFKPDGTFIRQMGSFGTDDGQFSRPHFIAVDSEGSVYVDDEPSGLLTKFGQTGAFEWRVPGGDQFADGMAVLPNGRIDHLQDSGRVITLDPATGEKVDEWGQSGLANGEIGNPCDLSVDKAGNEYLLSCAPGRTQVFDPQHQLIGGTYSVKGDQVFDPIFGPNGEVYATDFTTTDNIYILKDSLLTR